MSFNIGVNVVEVDGRAAQTIVPAPLSITGFLVRTVRGVPSSPVQVRGPADFVANFGGYRSGLFGAHAVRGFFANGGSEAQIVRILPSDAKAASATISDRASTPLPTLKLTAGMRGREDPGEWGNTLEAVIADHPRSTVDVPAQVIGSAQEPFSFTAAQPLSIAADGAGAIVVTLGPTDFATPGAVTAAEVASVISSRIASVRASATLDGCVVLATATAGPRSNLAITGAALTTLGLPSPSPATIATGATRVALRTTAALAAGSAVRFETRGHIVGASAIGGAAIPANTPLLVRTDGGAALSVNFAAGDFAGGLGAPTIDEVVRVINRQAVAFTAERSANDRLVILSNSYGPSSTIAVDTTVAGVLTALGLTGSTPVAGSREFQKLTFVSTPERVIAWTTGLASDKPVFATRIQSVEFDLIARRDGIEVERYDSLSMESDLSYFVESTINDSALGSRYLVAGALGSTSGPGLNAPAERRDSTTGQLIGYSIGGTVTGTDGLNPPADLDYLGDPATRTGRYAFDVVAIQLLVCPETTSAVVAAGCAAYCERRGDAMFIGTAPSERDLDQIKTYASVLRGRKVYGALYAPWIRVPNPTDATGTNPLLLVPPVGHVAGIYARIADQRGIWKAPAGDEAFVTEALGVEFDMTDVDHTSLVKDGAVNGIRAIPGAGVIIDSSRTLSSDTRWLFVNVRRLFNFVKVSLRDGLGFVRQEPHTEQLRRSVRFNVVQPFLLGLWRQGAFGSDPPEMTFSIKCDAENNPPSEVNLGNFKLEVYFYAVRPAETIVIVVGQQDSGPTSSEQ